MSSMGNSSTEPFPTPAPAGLGDSFSGTGATWGTIFLFSPAPSLFPLPVPLGLACLLFQSAESSHFRRICVPSLPACFSCGGCFVWGSVARRASRLGVCEMRSLLPSISLPASRAGIAVVPLAAGMMGTASTFSWAARISLGLLSSFGGLWILYETGGSLLLTLFRTGLAVGTGRVRTPLFLSRWIPTRYSIPSLRQYLAMPENCSQRH